MAMNPLHSPSAVPSQVRRISLLATLLASAVACFAGSDSAHKRPNIVLIIADDLGFGDVGAYGAKHIKTPNVDRLAAEGVRFTNGYAPAATCTPSRYSMFTGEYAWRQPVSRTSILPGNAALAIDAGRITMPEALRRAGYYTGAIGKWHLGLGQGNLDFNTKIYPGPNEIGFDFYHIIPATVDRVPSVWVENHYVVGLDPKDPIKVDYDNDTGFEEPTGLTNPELLTHYKGDKQHSGTINHGVSRIGYMSGGKAARFKDEELPNTIVDQSVKFLEKNADKPFFLYVGLFEPHVPRVAQDKFVGTTDIGVRGDVIQQMDWETGEILKALDRLKLTENTLVIFSSDNGPVLFDGYYDGARENTKDHQPAGGLRGWKFLVFEGGCRVPLIARWPAQIAPRVTDQIFSLVDIPATVDHIAGATFSEKASPDSLNLSAVLLGKTQENVRDHIVLQGVSDAFAIRELDWKYIPSNINGKIGGTGGANPSDDRFTESRFPEPLLFNLRDDPAETTNVIAKNPEKAAELQKKLDAIRSRPSYVSP
jgi:arylsulfatase A-like enzyme